MRHAVVLVALAMLGCEAEERPAKVDLVLPDLLTSTDPVPVTLRLTDETGGTKVTRRKHDYRVSPGGIASVTADGAVRCRTSGDAVMSVTVGGVSASTGIRCRLVEKVEASLPDRLVIQDGPVKLSVVAKDGRGSELHDVPFTARTTNTRAVRIKGLEVTPTAAGTTTIDVHAGKATAELETKVVRRVDSEPVTIGDGKRISFSLQPGTYELTVKLKKPASFSTEWVGVRRCNKTTKGAVHRSNCAVRQKTTLIIDNPGYLDTGDPGTIGKVGLYEVP